MEKGDDAAMWDYVRRYLHFAIPAALFMMGEVAMDLVQPGIMRRIVDEGVLGLYNGGTSDLHLIWLLGFQMAGLVLFGGLCGSFNNAFVHLAAQNIGNEMRKDCFRRIMAFSFPQLDRFGTGSLVTRVTNDITQVQTFVSTFVRGMIRTSFLMFGSMYLMFRLNREFGWIVLCAFPFIVGCLAFCLWKANPLFSGLQARLDAMNSIMQEDVSGIRIIKACVRETYEKLRFGKANDELVRIQMQVLVIFAFMNPVVNALMYVVVAVILLSGSYTVRAGQATPGTVMAAITYSTQLLNGILMLVLLFQNLSRGYVSWKRVREILKSEPELADGSFTEETKSHGEIEFRDVSFAYPGTGKLVLEHISLTIRKGETVAVMGATGCGKSSLVHLIPRFYEVTSGAVLVDGVDVRRYRQKDLRKKIAVTLQKSELFTGTIEENIAWGMCKASDVESGESAAAGDPGTERGKPAGAAGNQRNVFVEERVKSAALVAQADDFISSSPEGYQTAVAERGMSLSGGQKQRISIARAVAEGAEIMIFDDSTSALDLKTEADLYSALQKANPDSTKIIVAQRIASVRRADRIIVMDHGRIAACGSHGDLMKHCRIYRDIYDSQMGEEEKIHG